MKPVTKAFVAAVVALLMGASAALGYEVYNQAVTESWSTGSQTKKCSQTRAGTAHGNFDKGFSRGTAYSVLGAACGYPDERAAGDVKVVHRYQKRLSGGGWGVCWTSGWRKSGHRDWQKTHYREWQNRQPCGGGTYNTWARGGVLANSWRGVNVIVLSGNHSI